MLVKRVLMWNAPKSINAHSFSFHSGTLDWSFSVCSLFSPPLTLEMVFSERSNTIPSSFSRFTHFAKSWSAKGLKENKQVSIQSGEQSPIVRAIKPTITGTEIGREMELERTYSSCSLLGRIFCCTILVLTIPVIGMSFCHIHHSPTMGLDGPARWVKPLLTWVEVPILTAIHFWWVYCWALIRKQQCQLSTCQSLFRFLWSLCSCHRLG